jgi:hypothetical protein
MGFFKKLHNKVTAPDVNVEIKLGSYAVALGENLQGSLTLSSREDFDSTEIRCEVACTEEAKTVSYQYDAVIKRNVLKEVQESRVLFAAKPILNGATHVGNGENRNVPLNINIPAGGRPTYQGIDRRVTWTIKGVVAVDGRPDATSHAAEIQVVQPTAQPVFTGQTIVKEVVREVVKIPCRYCQTLFDQLEVTCPNCGAKRIA